MSVIVGPSLLSKPIVFYIDTQNSKSFNTYTNKFRDLTGKYDFTATGGTWSTGSPTASFKFVPTGYLTSDTQFSYNSQKLTVAMWIKMQRDTADQTILEGGNQSTTEGYMLIQRLADSDIIEYQYRTFTFQNDFSGGFASIFTGFDNVLINVCIVADYTNKTIKFYRNGIQFGTTQTMIGTPSAPTNPNTNYIGRAPNKGEFVTMCVYSRALTDNEILKNYNSQKTRAGLS